MRKVIFIVLFLIPSTTMADSIVYDTAIRKTAGETSGAITVTSTPNRIGLVGVASYSSIPSCSATWNGQSLTKVFDNLSSGGGGPVYGSVFYGADVTTGNIELTNCSPAKWNASSYAGVTTSTLDATSTQTGGGSQTLNHSTAHANAWAWGFAYYNDGNTYSSTGDWSALAGGDGGGDNNMWIGHYGPKVSTGTVQLGASSNGSASRINGVSFYPYTAPTTTPATPTATSTIPDVLNMADFFLDAIALALVGTGLYLKR